MPESFGTAALEDAEMAEPEEKKKQNNGLEKMFQSESEENLLYTGNRHFPYPATETLGFVCFCNTG